MTNDQMIKILQNASKSISYPIRDAIIFYNYDSEFLNVFNGIIKNKEFYIDEESKDSLLVKFSDVNELTEFILKIESSVLKAKSYQITIINQTLEGELDNV